ncbi:MAG: 2-amino-4-hydroxy-6-hydroxymethyldihydropteridine diphosphokinase [Chloroflexi bacterium]|nr:2-amino-4-hydroxy-6-hydroxymethyldihydropteridine diphosphokinase [Chloroflexota bacterium]
MSAARTPKQRIVCVELGGNIRPESCLPKAVDELLKRFELLQTSQVWETPPVGCEGCDNFLNAAALIQTNLSPDELKAIFRQMEREMGRVRTDDKFAPRTIDIDILVYDGEVIEPEIWEYAHLAVPVAELIPMLENVDNGMILSEVSERMQKEQAIKLRADVNLR